MKFKDIVTKRTYQSNGEEKAKWFNVGTLKETDDGKMFIDLNMFPNTDFYVFDQKERNQSSETPKQSNSNDIDVSNIPF